MMSTLLSVARYRWIFFLGMVVIAAIHFKVISWLEWSMQVSLTDSAVSNGTLMISMLAILNGMRYYVPKTNRYGYMLLWCLGLGVLSALAAFWILPSIIDLPEYALFLENSLLIRASLNFLVLMVLAMLHVVWFQQLQHSTDEAQKAESLQMVREAELFNLRQQLQPHFLFNSLNSINALIGSRPEEARNMVQQLAEFLRGTLRKDNKQSVTLEEELHLLRLYLEIEKVRFGHRLQVEILCDENCKTMKLPPLLLQPVVENAIKFGLYDTTGDVLISISAISRNQSLCIEVKNPYDPETSKPRQGTGFGLTSIQRRLYLLFARNDLLETSTDDRIFTCTVTIPQSP